MKLFFHDYQPEFEDLSNTIQQGLQKFPKQLHPKLFYDAIGSQIFDRICAQPEYYVPTIEQQIYTTYAHEIIQHLPSNCQIIEPGAGSSKKIRVLLDQMQPNLYAPMDISAEHLRNSAQKLSQDYPLLTIHAICVDHTQAYALPTEIPFSKRIFFYPGSSLGNFHPHEAIQFLQDLRNKVDLDGGLLIGIDTKKEHTILNNAYNDAAGATADFNLNLLQRINVELKSNIDINNFRHHAFYNAEKGRIEMHLFSETEQTIHINNNSFNFQADESIHTENSYKYTVAEFQALAAKSGWQSHKVWQDEKKYFSVHFLKPSKN